MLKTVLKDLIEPKYQIFFLELINNNTFPWYHADNIIRGRTKEFENFKNITETHALEHVLYLSPKGINSHYYEVFQPIINNFEKRTKFKVKEMLRCRLRRTFPTVGHTLDKYNYPHTDLNDKQDYKSLIYYFEDSDGDTVWFNEKFELNKPTPDLLNIKPAERQTPKKGDGVWFEGNQYHAGNNPVNYNIRTVINFDFHIYGNNN